MTFCIDQTPLATATRYITIEEAAELLHVHPKTIRRMIGNGQLRGHRLGSRMIRVRSDDVVGLLHPIPVD